MTNTDLTMAATELAELVAAVPDEALTSPTPLPAYALGDLIEHIGRLALAFAAAAEKYGAGREAQPPGDATRLPADWRTRIPRDLAALARAWNAPGAWDGMTRIASMDTPAEMVGVTAADELVVHGWDVARATGREYRPDPAALEAARTFLDLIADPNAPAGPTVAFGPPRQVAATASQLDQIIALAGRDPAWTRAQPGDPRPARLAEPRPPACAGRRNNLEDRN